MRTGSWKDVWACLIKHGVFTVIAIVAIGMMGAGLAELIHFEQVTHAAPTLSGQITRVEEHTDSEGDTSYDAYVGYEYQNVRYIARYDTYGSDSAYEMVGKTVSFRIDPENHGTLIDNVHENAKALLYGGLIAFAFFGTIVVFEAWDCFETGVDFTYAEIYGMTSENIQRDLMHKAGGRRRAFIGFLTGVVLIPCGLLLPQAMGGAVVFGVIGLMIGGIFCSKYLKRCRRIRAGEYQIRTARVMKKEIEPDSDGPDTYYIYCTDGKRNWRTMVDKHKFDAVREEQALRCVFFESLRGPEITYWNAG